MNKEIQEKYDELLRVAQEYMNRSYSPYSKVKVGAAILTTSGKVFGGCNVENASYGLTNCAERVAIQTMVATGEKSFIAILLTANTRSILYPCGACRQVMTEFADKIDPYVILVPTSEKIEIHRLSSLIPHQVRTSDLQVGGENQQA